MTNQHPSLSDRLRAAIRAIDISREELARQTRVSAPMISRFMHDVRDMNLRTATKLCHFLGLDLLPRRRRRR